MKALPRVLSLGLLLLSSSLLVGCGELDNEVPPEQIDTFTQALEGDHIDISPRCTQRTLPGGIVQVRCEQGLIVCYTDYWPGGRADTRCYRSGTLIPPLRE